MSAQIVTISRPMLHQQVAQQLRQMLVEGRVAPGAKLNERELCEHLRVSRTPLREAIKMLAAEGLVELLPNRGAVALQLSEADVGHTFEVMAQLESMNGELAAQRATQAQIDEIRALNDEMLAAYTHRDLPGYYALNARIHRAFNLAANNPVLTGLYETINARVQALRYRTNQDEGKWQRAVAEHGRMVELLVARDGDGLRNLLSQHLLHKRDVVIGQLRAQEQSRVRRGG
jgi:DNA-binding GntR family transcriptional regulator